MGTRRRRCMIVVGLLLLGLLVATIPSWGDYIGEVVHTQGKAELLKSQVQPPESNNWEKLAYKGTVFLLDTIRTAAESTVETLLEYQELDTVWTLFENGKIHFTEEEAICEVRGAAQPQQRIAYLDEGTIRGVVSRRSDAAPAGALRTPNAVVCATGTIFMVRFIPPNTTIVIVLEGRVLVRTFAPASSWVEVEAGYRTEVVDTQPPTDPTRLSAEALQRTRQQRVIGQVHEVMHPAFLIDRLPRFQPGPRLQPSSERPEVPGDTTVSPAVQRALGALVEITFEPPNQ